MAWSQTNERGIMSHSPDTDNPPAYAEDEITGLPMLPTWRRVYWFVVIVFVAYVVLLSALSQVFA
jgi:hypothetical protein